MAVPPPFLILLIPLLAAAAATAATIDPGDLAVLEDLRGTLTNAADVLAWPKHTDACAWPHVSCDRAGRVNNLDLKNANLAGTLPASFPTLTALQDLSLQNNALSGPLPSFAGMASLRHAYLNGNDFLSIPADFFSDLADLEEICLDDNPRLNASTGGWRIPPSLPTAAPQLRVLRLDNCSLVGPIPPALGAMTALQSLMLAYNNLTGAIPPTFSSSAIQTLWLNNQRGDADRLSGPLSFLAGMTRLQQAWLHGNHFSGPIPDAIANLTQLTQLWLNGNRLVGLVPPALLSLPLLHDLKLDDNALVGPAPALLFPGANVTFSHNGFCGAACAPEVTALLGFLAGVGFPQRLAESWAGNDPCSRDWLGVSCYQGKVTLLNLPGYGLNGSVSASLANLSALSDVRLNANNLTGRVPDSLASLKSLRKLDLSTNDLTGPLPAFGHDVSVNVDGNPGFNGPSAPAHRSPTTPPSTPADSPNTDNNTNTNKKSKSALVLAVTIPVAITVLALVSLGAVLLLRKKNNNGSVQPQASSVVVHPRDGSGSDPDNLVKIAMASSDSFGGTSSATSSRDSDIHMIEARSFVIAVQVLRSATKNFAQDNVLGRGGFGVVYKGVLHDGTMIAVKRMESSVISNKALDEFQAEIAILTKVRHRNLVSILGYAIEGNERLLVYEHMSNGALSKHLFQWKVHGLEPLSWKKRLNIALDVARGMEYLHTLAQQCYIHRDLKPANILLGDDFRAKVSDFGLLKSAPDGNFSVATRLAGTFGYLAPEYAVTGKITTKADVFSFGVVLMELITGMTAIDERRIDEETRYLASWFCQIRKDEEKFRAAIDPALVLTDEILESISVIADLAGHCTSREPLQRPDMGHAVTVLVPMVEKWKPSNNEAEDYMGIDLHLPLLQMVKGWQESEASMTDGDSILSRLDDSKGSIPARPAGFAESFTSADGR
ncbi:hypothetical protein QYE76_047689 [Lolium multiflorum]|uniref:non-specific serine/threonine protein kinase n=1 Tax=Lolium multiflorum TaxID=4521 RepID=A0AAD8TQU6_LOLMU|nr:hypothetical protein QYE76_047689 [Lolium multiflorum]